jgi:hypothetical protein
LEIAKLYPQVDFRISSLNSDVILVDLVVKSGKGSCFYTVFFTVESSGCQAYDFEVDILGVLIEAHHVIKTGASTSSIIIIPFLA